jgi:peptide chain release factor 1
MLKPKTQEKILAEIVEIVSVFDRRYLKSDKQSEWCKKVISTHDLWQQFRQELIDAKEIAIVQTEDFEWRSIIKLEIAELELKIANLQQELYRLTADIYPYKHRNIFLEISAIAGGEEASIWVQDLVQMYTRYAEQCQHWKVELVSESNNDPYGFRQAILEIRGALVGCFFQFENGFQNIRFRNPNTIRR